MAEGRTTHILVPKYGKVLGQGFTRREKIDAYAHPGRRRDGTQTAASWITELSDNRKGIVLCSFCRHNFNPRRNHYRTYAGRISGQCDACHELVEGRGGGVFFIAEDFYEQVTRDPQENRIRQRMGIKSFRKYFRR